ncbi:MAG: thioesterase family protein [Acidobacteria bacterium]|nr:thioesterase family protein [Acidobacteriota bacterium]
MRHPPVHTCDTPSESGGSAASASLTPASQRSAARIARLRVRYAETDQMGIVYYANYLVWFEVGRTDWLRQTGWTYRDMERDGVSLPVIEAHCEYRHASRYDDEITISTRATLVTAVRIRFDYEVTRNIDETIAAVGHTVHAAVDPTGKPCRLPSRVRDMLA